jgi:hypothetical protein
MGAGHEPVTHIFLHELEHTRIKAMYMGVAHSRGFVVASGQRTRQFGMDVEVHEGKKCKGNNTKVEINRILKHV